MPTFGERLQQLREKAGLTQEAILLARAIGVTVEAFADCSEQPLPKRARGRNAAKPRRGRL
jgi:transcriptional regulator with XRE-family HTH domain